MKRPPSSMSLPRLSVKPFRGSREALDTVLVTDAAAARREAVHEAPVSARPVMAPIAAPAGLDAVQEVP